MTGQFTRFSVEKSHRVGIFAMKSEYDHAISTLLQLQGNRTKFDEFIAERSKAIRESGKVRVEATEFHSR